MQTRIWTSKALHITTDTCVDVKADDQGVVLGQLGSAWLHNLHLTPDQSRIIARALLQGADEAEARS